MAQASSLTQPQTAVPTPATARGMETAAALHRCARDDRAALRVVYDNEAAAMLGIAYRILRRRDLAEEIVQEAFARVWRYAGRYDPELGSARSWLFAITRNLALKALRKGAREISGTELEERAQQAQQSAAELAENSSLRRCLERLDVAKRNCLLMAYVGGFTHEEIAANLHTPLGTVKTWIRRGLLALRECLG